MSELGKPIEATRDKFCLTCKHFVKCKDPNKSFEYACSKFKKLPTFFIKNSPKEKRKELERQIDSLEEGDGFKTILQDALKDNHVGGQKPDVKINDRDLPLAKNFLEFATDKKYLGIKTLYSKQAEVGLRLYNDICINPKCTDHKFLKDMAVDTSLDKFLGKVQLLEYGVCPKCKKTRLDFIRKGEMNDWTEFDAMIGQRGGKSFLTSVISAYTTHWYLKIPNPPQYFGLTQNSYLHGTFVGIDFKQSKETLWTPFSEWLQQDEGWFHDYHELLNDYMLRTGDDSLFKLKDEYVQYRHRFLRIYPASPNKKALRGRTRFVGGIDEIGWFDASDKGRAKVKDSAPEVYAAMANSFRTIRTQVRKLRRQGQVHLPVPMFCNISSPSSVNDQITKLYKQSQDSRNRHIFGVKLPTWKFNPEYSKEDLLSEFVNNEQVFWRDFGCRPSLSSNAFVESLSSFKAVIAGDLENAATIVPKKITTRSGTEMTSGRLHWRWDEDGIGKLMCIDPGSDNNAFGITVCHLQGGTVPMYDFIGEVQPIDATRISSLDIAKKILVPLIEQFNVKMVVSDRWQNQNLQQVLEAETGVVIEECRLKYDDFLTWREALYQGNFIFPKPEVPLKKKFFEKAAETYPLSFRDKPVTHLIYQALTVVDNEGDSVDKGEGTNDDMFRTVVMGHTYLTNPEYSALFKGIAMRKHRGSDTGVAISQGRGNAGMPGDSNLVTLGRNVLTPNIDGYGPAISKR